MIQLWRRVCLKKWYSHFRYIENWQQISNRLYQFCLLWKQQQNIGTNTAVFTEIVIWEYYFVFVHQNKGKSLRSLVSGKPVQLHLDKELKKKKVLYAYGKNQIGCCAWNKAQIAVNFFIENSFLISPVKVYRLSTVSTFWENRENFYKEMFIMNSFCL